MSTSKGFSYWYPAILLFFLVGVLAFDLNGMRGILTYIFFIIFLAFLASLSRYKWRIYLRTRTPSGSMGCLVELFFELFLPLLVFVALWFMHDIIQETLFAGD